MDKDNRNQSGIRVAMGSTSLVGQMTGIGNYTLNLAKALTKNSNLSTEYFYGYKWSLNIEHHDSPKVTGLRKLFSRFFPYAYRVRRFIEQSAFNSRLKNGRFDLYHEPNFIPLDFDGATVITVHDLSFIRFPETHPSRRVKMLNKKMSHAIFKADSIIVDSQFTKDEILSMYDEARDKIHVVYLGASDNFYPRSESDTLKITKKYGLTPGEYVLAVGTLEPRKNLVQVLRAYRDLPEYIAKRFPLVVAGMRGWKEQALIEELNILIEQGKAKILGYIPSDELPILYSGARAFVFPSMYEGFGLPVLEAMACGTPVIASNSSSIPEVVGNAAMLVDVGNVEGMTDCIKKVCLDDMEYSRLSSLGLIQAKKFSWEKCAEETYLAYLYAIEHSR